MALVEVADSDRKRSCLPYTALTDRRLSEIPVLWPADDTVANWPPNQNETGRFAVPLNRPVDSRSRPIWVALEIRAIFRPVKPHTGAVQLPRVGRELPPATVHLAAIQQSLPPVLIE